MNVLAGNMTKVLKADGSRFEKVREIVISLPFDDIVYAEVTWLCTDENGEVIIESDGKAFWPKTDKAEYIVTSAELGQNGNKIVLGNRLSSGIEAKVGE